MRKCFLSNVSEVENSEATLTADLFYKYTLFVLEGKFDLGHTPHNPQ